MFKGTRPPGIPGTLQGTCAPPLAFISFRVLVLGALLPSYLEIQKQAPNGPMPQELAF